MTDDSKVSQTVSYYKKFSSEMTSFERKTEVILHQNILVGTTAYVFDSEWSRKLRTVVKELLKILPIIFVHVFVQHTESNGITLRLLFMVVPPGPTYGDSMKAFGLPFLIDQNSKGILSQRLVSYFNSQIHESLTLLDNEDSYPGRSLKNEEGLGLGNCFSTCIEFPSLTQCHCYLNWKIYNYSSDHISFLSHGKIGRNELDNLTREDVVQRLEDDHGITWEDVPTNDRYGTFYRKISVSVGQEKPKDKLSSRSFLPIFQEFEANRPFFFDRNLTVCSK